MKKEIIRNILKVFAVGGVSALLSAAAGCAAYAAVYLFRSVIAAGGYLAVVYFAAALATAAAAPLLVYCNGVWVVRKGRFSK